MKTIKTIMLFLILIPSISNCQVNNNIIFGIDLNLSWNTLTNYDALTYFEKTSNSKNKYTVTDFSAYNHKINRDFLNLNFTEILLCFPKTEKPNLNELKPELLIARIRYENYSDYINKSSIDIKKILSVLRKEFGESKLSEVKENFSYYNWEDLNYSASLVFDEKNLTATFAYLKN